MARKKEAAFFGKTLVKSMDMDGVPVLPVRPQLGMSLKVLWFWPLVTLKAIRNPWKVREG